VVEFLSINIDADLVAAAVVTGGVSVFNGRSQKQVSTLHLSQLSLYRPCGVLYASNLLLFPQLH
jgi:hypothetical protein